MKISELTPGTYNHAALASNVLAVLSRGQVGWCVYVGAVPGQNHSHEWAAVAATGDKQGEQLARAIVDARFPNLEIDLPYEH